MKKALVTGGAGFIGSHLCKRLLDENYEVVCIDNLSTGKKDNIIPFISSPYFSFINKDITETLPLKLTINYIFHLASPASPNHHSPYSYFALAKETMMANSVGTLKMLELAKKNNAKFLFTSTSEIYGNPLEHPQKESYYGNVSTTGPRSVYDESKRFGETLVAYFWNKEGVDGRIARIFNTYGPQMQEADMRMIISFITQAISGKPITIFGDGSQTRSLCFIDDMVEGLMRLMFKENTRCEIVNLGAVEEHTVLEFANIIKKLTNSSSKIIFSEPLPKDDPQKRRPDISKAKTILNWQPKTSLKDGLNKTIDYFRKNK